MNVSRKSGLYFHIPFCQSKCGYCDFYSIVDTSLTSTFINVLCDEIKLTAEQLKTEDKFDTIYIGGGTPSLLNPDMLNSLLMTARESFCIDSDCETTLEINPGTLSSTKLKELLDLNINRMSIGVQSFVQEELRFLDRIHTVDDSINTIVHCRDIGFENINLDLIYAIPIQTSLSWNYSLEKALSYSPEHLSIYNLTYEKETPFYEKLRTGKIVSLDEEQEIELFSSAHSRLTEAGYCHYEVSNYARSESNYSRHNYKYWQHTPYLGFGPSAHSFWENSRWANDRSVIDYLAKLKKGHLPRSFLEKLTIYQLISEHILLTLRTYQGLSMTTFENRFGINFIDKFYRETQKLIENKLAIIQDDHFKLTEKGILICDEILLQFTTAF